MFTYEVEWRKLYLGIKNYVIVALWSQVCVIDYLVLRWVWIITLFTSSNESRVLRS